MKTPGRSPVKTRLAASVGQVNAERFYRLSIAAVGAVAKSLGPDGPTPYWAVAEEDSIDHPNWAEFERVAQGPGGLGERLDAVYRGLLLRHPAVLLIGADAPLLTPQVIAAAAKVVSNPATTFALCRSHDGGYALFAGARPLPSEVWTAVPYSCGRTAEEFITRLRPHGAVVELPPIDDVDTAADLPRLVAAASEVSLLPEQAAVVAFARRLLGLPGDD